MLIARKVGEKKFKEFLDNTSLLKSPDLPLEEVGRPINFEWNKCKLETISFGHGITTTPIQATALYATLSNGGKIIKHFFDQKNLIEERRDLSQKKQVKK